MASRGSVSAPLLIFKATVSTIYVNCIKSFIMQLDVAHWYFVVVVINSELEVLHIYRTYLLLYITYWSVVFFTLELDSLMVLKNISQHWVTN